jgi:RNA polymerase sigma factor (sigma-70 family)
MSTEPDWLTDDLLREARAVVSCVPGLNAADLVQEIVVRILEQPRGFERFGTARDFVAYVRTAARNLVIDHMRRVRKYARIPCEILAFNPLAAHPEERAYQSMLDSALRTLTPKEREVFLLRQGGYANREIALLLGVGKNEPAKLGARARATLEAHFGVSTRRTDGEAWATVERAAAEASTAVVGGHDADAQARWLDALRWAFPRAASSERARDATLTLVEKIADDLSRGTLLTSFGPGEADRYFRACVPLAEQEQSFGKAWVRLASLRRHFVRLGRVSEAVNAIHALSSLVLRTRNDVFNAAVTAMIAEEDAIADLRASIATIALLADAQSLPHFLWEAMFHLTNGYIALREPLLARSAAHDYASAVANAFKQPSLRVVAIARRWPGRIALLERKWDDAIESFSALEQTHQDLATVVWLAFALAMAGRVSEARAKLRLVTRFVRGGRRTQSKRWLDYLDYSPYCSEDVQRPLFLARIAVALLDGEIGLGAVTRPHLARRYIPIAWHASARRARARRSMCLMVPAWRRFASARPCAVRRTDSTSP